MHYTHKHQDAAYSENLNKQLFNLTIFVHIVMIKIIIAISLAIHAAFK